MQLDGTRLSAQGEPAGEGAGRGCAECASWRERERVLLQRLSGAEGNARYWQSMHRRAQERAAKYEALQREQAGKLGELERQVEVLQQENAGLQQRNRDLLKKPFGTSSEKRPQGQDGEQGDGGPAGGGQPGQGTEKRRQRGGQPGAAAPKRVDRSGLPRREEVLEPEPGRCSCPECGLAYARNGEAVSERVEVWIEGHIRRIRRPRYRAVCECVTGRGEVVAALEPTLFRGSGYGLSVWVIFLLQVYWQRHPARAFEREWEEYGVRLPASTLLGHTEALLGWFEPLEQAIAAHQQQALLIHGDETSWVVHVRAEEGEKARCWLWACLTEDAVRLRVDPSRSAAAAARLFGELGRQQRAVLVCDRYAVYPRLAREHEGQFEIAYCWAHVRRDFVKLGRSRPDLEEWAEGILGRIGRLYRYNGERLALWDRERSQPQGADFQAVQGRLEAECAALFGQAEREVGELTAAAGASGRVDPRLKPLQSLLKHRKGLEVFLAKPFVPMDNNPVERALRRPVIGRKLSYGSHSEGGAALQGILLSVFGTLTMAGISLQRWLEAYLGECAAIGPRAVPWNPHSWLPWGLSQERAQTLQAAPRRHRGPAP